MPDITFDGRKVSVPAGTNLIEAANQAGVHVPVFCYQKDLGAVGACRVCAVTVTADGKSRTVMGCMTQAQDGMDVTTLDPKSMALRKYVIEWLMENHPHDCPICDEGGECQLQDLTIAGGHGIRRYSKKKRTFQNQHLGEFIVHEMNRCITCYRCSRFYQDYAGGRDFSATGSRDRVYFGRFEEGPFESPFSGNLVEMCPTGVFTDKLFRYKSRVWDLEIAPSVCPHCSVGCNVRPGARHRMLQRVRTGVNPEVNGTFLCDRGQFGHGYVMDPARPRTIRANGAESTWEEAVGLASGSLLAIAREHGAGSIAVIGSARASLETHASMRALAAGPLEGVRVSHFDDPAREARALAALAAHGRAGVPALDQGAIADCDVLLIVGASLVDEAPLAALAARQVARHGGRVFVLNVGEHYLGSVAEAVLPVDPADLAATLGEITSQLSSGGGGGSNGKPTRAAVLERVRSALAAAKRPGILAGSDLLDGATIAAAADLAKALAAKGQEIRLGYLFPGPNGFGAAALSDGAALPSLLRDLEGGKLRAAILVEADPSEWGEAAIRALGKLDLVVVLDYLHGTLHDHAKVFLPTTVTYESSGIYVNRAGRAQEFAPARVPGLDVIVQIKDATFPRTFRETPPDGNARPAWWVLEQLRELAIGKPAARNLTAIRDMLRRGSELWKPLPDLRPGSHGVVLDATAHTGATAELPSFTKSSGRLTLYRMDRTLGSEALSRRSQPMQKMAGAPVASISPADAARLGIERGLTIEVDGAKVALAARVMPSIPAGVVLVPRDVPWPRPLAQGVAVNVQSAEPQEVSR